jgi:hypothetical protein
MRMKSLYLFLGFAAVPFVVQAQTAESDSVNTQQLKEVVVEGDLQTTNAKMSTYIPTGREKMPRSRASTSSSTSAYRN